VPALPHLALCNGGFADAGAAALRAATAALRHLDELDVRDNCLSGRAREASPKKVVTGDQKSPDERYVSLGE
jgi:hypothetical protein